MDSNSSMRVLGQAQGTIPDLWSGGLHTFSALSRNAKSVEIRYMPETNYDNRRLIWKIAPGGAKIGMDLLSNIPDMFWECRTPTAA